MKKVLILIGILGILGITIFHAIYTREPAAWKEVKADVLPQLMKARNKSIMPLIHRPFSKDLDIGYVIDGEKRYNFIMQPQLEQLGVSQDIVHTQAMKNLELLVNDTQYITAKADDSANGTYIIIEETDGFAATRILSPTLQHQVVSELGPEATIAIPVRDILIAWPKGFPLESAFISQVKQEFSKEEIYNLTTDLFTAGVAQTK